MIARPAFWRWLGRASFGAVAQEQERLRAAVLAGEGPETLLLCEHDPVVTLGRSARSEHVLVSPPALARDDIELARATRGGAATYHGPGQLVGYPVVRLRGGVVDHLRALAGALAALLGDLGIESRWRREAPGLWVGKEKICAFGVHIHRRVAIHGFALNVTSDVDRFRLIVPCGMPGARATSIARLLGAGAAIPALHLLAARAAVHLGAALGIPFIPEVVRPILVGTLKGFPHPPAMSSARQSWATLDAI